MNNLFWLAGMASLIYTAWKGMLVQVLHDHKVFCLGEVCVASDYRTPAAKTNAPHNHPHFKFKFRHESNVLIYVMQRHVEKL